MTRADLTVRQKVLVAAVGLDADGVPLTNAHLTVRVWKLFPESFSLQGYEALHPDSNRVLAKLAGDDGLCGLGWLERLSDGAYRVTRRGRAVAARLRAVAAQDRALALLPPAPTTPPPPPTPRVEAPTRPTPEPKVVEAKAAKPARARAAKPAPKTPVVPLTDGEKHSLTMVARSAALQKFLRGAPLAFADACAFWGIHAAAPADVARARLDAVAALLARAVASFGGDAADPRMPTLATCYGLFNVDRLMRERFARELAALTAAEARTP